MVWKRSVWITHARQGGAVHCQNTSGRAWWDEDSGRRGAPGLSGILPGLGWDEAEDLPYSTHW